MRPYFVPERSRTKSESLDLSQTLPEMTSEPQLGHHLTQFNTTTTTNSASYSVMSHATLMDTSGASRSPGILAVPQFEYESVSGDVIVRGYPMEPRRMRLKMIQALKKSKSMEDVRAEVNVDGSQLSHEMEFVSSRIQKLKVQEQE